MFLRRLFYDGATGESLYTYEMRGDFEPTDTATDPNRPAGDNVAHLDWTTPDPDVEMKFTEQRTLTVNVETHELIWGEPGSAIPPESEQPDDGDTETELADAVAALEMLGYTEGDEANG